MDALVWLRKQLETDDNDLVREMVRGFAEELMGAEADAICGAGYGEISADRINRRNGYRSRRWDTRTGSIDLKIPKLRTGSYFPDWLLDARTRSERAFIQVVARGLTGVQLVISDDHTVLVDAIGATLPGAPWQRCRTHYLRNLLTKVPKSSGSMVATMVRTIFAQPDPKSVWAQHRRIVGAADHLDQAGGEILTFTGFP